jgi:ribosomal-protein-alanine N-acetyltransferase
VPAIPPSPPAENGFTLLPASWRDLNALRAFEREVFPDDSWPLIDLIAVLTWPGVVRLKAVAGGALVGFASGDIREGVAWVTTIGVMPAFRRRGIAEALLEACERQMGNPRIRLCVRRSNLSAIRLYEKWGYRQVDTWRNYYNGGEDALVMEKIRL